MAAGITNVNVGSKNIQHWYSASANESFTVDKTKFKGLIVQKVASDTGQGQRVMDPNIIALVVFNGLTTGRTIKCGTSGTSTTTLILTVQNNTDSEITFVTPSVIAYCLIG